MPFGHWSSQVAAASHARSQYSTQRTLQVEPAAHSARAWSPRTNVQLARSEQATLALRPVVSAQWLAVSHSAEHELPQVPTHVVDE